MRSGKIRQDAARRMQRKVKAVLKADKSWLTAEVGERIVLELREGKVQSKRAAPATMPTSVPKGTWGKKRGEAKASSPTHYLLLNSPNLGGDNEGTDVFHFLPSSPVQILLAKPFSGTSLFRHEASLNQPIQVKQHNGRHELERNDCRPEDGRGGSREHGEGFGDVRRKKIGKYVPTEAEDKLEL